ncbi:hypothetical protein EL75_4872 [Escherichia coli]|nr:hypothetical protein EL75_4872 [Escherichia coli]KGM75073.1 hypothetical protein EL80_5254 [Escherichia coli]KGM78382.1 hypothetical protein EL79_5079 [Escherichia coli]
MWWFSSYSLSLHELLSPELYARAVRTCHGQKEGNRFTVVYTARYPG